MKKHVLEVTIITEDKCGSDLASAILESIANGIDENNKHHLLYKFDVNELNQSEDVDFPDPMMYIPIEIYKSQVSKNGEPTFPYTTDLKIRQIEDDKWYTKADEVIEKYNKRK